MGCMWLQRKLFGHPWKNHIPAIVDEDEHIYEEIDDLNLNDSVCFGSRFCTTKLPIDIFSKKSDWMLVMGKPKPLKPKKDKRGVVSSEENFYIPMEGVRGRKDSVLHPVTANFLGKDTCNCDPAVDKGLAVVKRKVPSTQVKSLETLLRKDDNAKLPICNSTDTSCCIGTYIDSLYMDGKAGMGGSSWNLNYSSITDSASTGSGKESWKTSLDNLPFCPGSVKETTGQCNSVDNSYGFIAGIGMPWNSHDSDAYVACFGDCVDSLSREEKYSYQDINLKGLLYNLSLPPRSTVSSSAVSQWNSSAVPSESMQVFSDYEGKVPKKGNMPAVSHFNKYQSKLKSVENYYGCTVKNCCQTEEDETVDYVNTKCTDVEMHDENFKYIAHCSDIRPNAKDKSMSAQLVMGKHGQESLLSKHNSSSDIESKVTNKEGSLYDCDKKRTNNKVLLDLILLNNRKQL